LTGNSAILKAFYQSHTRKSGSEITD
jgi:hypothetical protein